MIWRGIKTKPRLKRILLVLTVAFVFACGDDGSALNDAGTDSDSDTDTETMPEIEFPCSWKQMYETGTGGLNGIWGSAPDDVFTIVKVRYIGLVWGSS